MRPGGPVARAHTSSIPSSPSAAGEAGNQSAYAWSCLLDMQEEFPGTGDEAGSSQALLNHKLDNIRATFALHKPGKSWQRT